MWLLPVDSILLQRNPSRPAQYFDRSNGTSLHLELHMPTAIQGAEMRGADLGLMISPRITPA